MINEQKVVRAVEECLALMDADPADGLVVEVEYLSRLQCDEAWSHDDVEAVRVWIKKALDRRDCLK